MLLSAAPPQTAAPPEKSPAARPGPQRTAVASDEILISAIRQEVDPPWRRLRGMARIETSTMLITADEIDYNPETDYAEARGNVHFRNFEGGEELWAQRVEYDIGKETGKYFNVRGSSPPKLKEIRPGVLPTRNPFVFEGRWAERIRNRYILHEGFITNCRLPRPAWTLRGPKFDIIPNDRAIARNAVFRIKKIPLFYAPYFYKSLEELPRKSGFLTPNIGNSSRRGKMLGAGYYWAINRSYDATYRMQYFTQRGVAHHVDLRGKPTRTSDFNFILYGVNDRGRKLETPIDVYNADGTFQTIRRIKEGGYMMSFDGRSELPLGFRARGEMNYLSDFTFRQAWTESFYEAIFSSVHTLGFVTRQWSSYGLNFVFQRSQLFQSTAPGDSITIRKLPVMEFHSRDRQISSRVLPFWVSLESSAGFVRRNQPLFQTRQFVERIDFSPRLMTALRWKDFHLIPSFGIRETYYGSSNTGERIAGGNVRRGAREFGVELIAPSLARVFDSPLPLMGVKVKHVIETRVSFRDVSGVEDFEKLIRFDDTELVTNTREIEISLTNRLYGKFKDGQVRPLLSWQLWQKRYFDPTFGGAVAEDRRNVVLSSAELSGYAFLDGPRRYSPVISVVRLNPAPNIGVSWRMDYDPHRRRVSNSGISGDARFTNYFVSIGHEQVRSHPVLTPSANQFRGLLGLGKQNQPGWGAAFSAIYDFRSGIMQYATTQVTYNTDCCGISFQYRRFSFGARNENQFRVAFAIANIGSFGTLKKQETLF